MTEADVACCLSNEAGAAKVRVRYSKAERGMLNPEWSDQNLL